ncbi:calcium-binding protein [Methylobacterium sp. WSM2598]|uniref:calcium-binding protein n=1 Tax=Methylobacterium sp. WSM2598 TaxID=398261 RepID=UPI0012F65B65|nr:calcium-binding protein [Methylobacterium sp. WSM2598]
MPTGYKKTPGKLVSSTGNNALYGTDDNDTISGAGGDHVMVGYNGHDVYIIDSIGDKIVETYTGGHDTVISKLTTYTLGDDLEDLIFGGLDDFQGTGNSLSNLMVGGIGNDTLDGGDGWDTLQGGAGNDVLKGGNLFDDLFGGAGDDVLYGGDASGDDGYSDRLDGGTGADTMVGGNGNDSYTVDTVKDVIIEKAGQWSGSDTVHTSLRMYELPDNVENLRFDAHGELVSGYLWGYGNESNNFMVLNNDGGYLQSDGGDDTLIGGTGADELWGGLGNDIVVGWDGNDILAGQDGHDTVDGGLGNDLIRADADGDMVFGGSGNDTVDYSWSPSLYTGIVVHADGRVTGGTGTDQLSDVENIVGTSFADVLLGLGDHVANKLVGGLGDDFFDGRGGADTLDGGYGWDSVTYAQSEAGVFVNLMTGKGSGGDAEGNTLVSIENVFGSQYDDSVFGGAERNYLSGRGGVDNLYGGGGDDRLEGGEGGDVLDGGIGFDWADYRNASSGVTVDLVNQAANQGEAKGDVLTGIEALDGSAHGDNLRGNGEANELWGNDGADYLFGRAGVDTLRGGSGNDYLEGGAGKDDLWGGAGADNFAFRNPAEGGDRLHDFKHGEDFISIELKNFVDLKHQYYPDHWFEANATGAAKGWMPQVVYNTTDGTLWFDDNGAAVGGASLIATLGKVGGVAPTVTVGDILLS